MFGIKLHLDHTSKARCFSTTRAHPMALEVRIFLDGLELETAIANSVQLSSTVLSPLG